MSGGGNGWLGYWLCGLARRARRRSGSGGGSRGRRWSTVAARDTEEAGVVDVTTLLDLESIVGA